MVSAVDRAAAAAARFERRVNGTRRGTRAARGAQILEPAITSDSATLAGEPLPQPTAKPPRGIARNPKR